MSIHWRLCFDYLLVDQLVWNFVCKSIYYLLVLFEYSVVTFHYQLYIPHGNIRPNLCSWLGFSNIAVHLVILKQNQLPSSEQFTSVLFSDSALRKCAFAFANVVCLAAVVTISEANRRGPRTVCTHCQLAAATLWFPCLVFIVSFLFHLSLPCPSGCKA